MLQIIGLVLSFLYAANTAVLLGFF